MPRQADDQQNQAVEMQQMAAAALATNPPIANSFARISQRLDAEVDVEANMTRDMRRQLNDDLAMGRITPPKHKHINGLLDKLETALLRSNTTQVDELRKQISAECAQVPSLNAQWTQLDTLIVVTFLVGLACPYLGAMIYLAAAVAMVASKDAAKTYTDSAIVKGCVNTFASNAQPAEPTSFDGAREVVGKGLQVVSEVIDAVKVIGNAFR